MVDCVESDMPRFSALQCQAIKGSGFRVGGYRCVCRKGFYSDLEVVDADTGNVIPFTGFTGAKMEEEYKKKQDKYVIKNDRTYVRKDSNIFLNAYIEHCL